MPKNGMAKKRGAALYKNTKALDDVVNTKSGTIGRVEKALGNSAFQVMLGDGSLIQGLIRGCLKGGKTSVSYISAGVFVIMAYSEESGSRNKVYEILGVIKEAKDLKKLKSSGLLPELLCSNSTADDLFDREEEEEEGADAATTGASHFRVKEGSSRAAMKETLQAITEPTYDVFQEATVKKASVTVASKSRATTEMTGIFEPAPAWTSAWKDDVAPAPKLVERGAVPTCWEEEEIELDKL